jgi:chemotaxis protein CheD
MHDGKFRVAGLAHILLPDPSLSREVDQPARFATTAVPLLVDAMRQMGARGELVAKIAGGASLFGAMLTGTGGQVGARNVASAKASLAKAGIALVGEETGGVAGRSVTLDVNTGVLHVRSVRGGERVL